MSANVIFFILFAIFCVILVGAGVISKRWVKDSSDYILAGREISTFINMIGVAAIGFAGTTVALAPGFAIQMGLKASLAWGVIYAICGLMLFALLFSNFIRRSGAQTLPEYLELRYDGKVRSVVAITSVLGMSGILANNIVSCTNAIVGYTKWNPTLVMGVIFLIIIAFTFISGLWATTLTDFFQVTLGVVIVPVFLLLLSQRYGWFDAINAAWPGGDVFATGVTGASVKGMALTYPSILNFVICFAAALVWGNNYYWMKIANCRSEKVAKNSFVLASLILVVIFIIPLAIIGTYGGAFMKDAFTAPFGSGTVPPTGVYGLLASTFPAFVGSFFVIGAVAASISTASTAALGASAVATRDIYQRLVRPGSDAKSTLKASKFIMVGIGILTWLFCQFPGGPTYLFAFANSWLVPPAILLGLGVIWPRFNSRGAIAGALSGMICMAVFTALEITKVFVIGNHIYLATFGFLVTLVVAVLASLTGKPKYYGESNWERVPTALNRKDIALNELDKKVLSMIRTGHCYMSDITDALGVDSKTSGDAVANLDMGGYIVREGMKGSKFFTFTITEKGLAALNPLEGAEAELSKEMLTPLYLELLSVVKENPENQSEFVRKNNIHSMQMSSICSHLTRQGYIIEGGLFKRKLKITDKGIAAVKKFA